MDMIEKVAKAIFDAMDVTDGLDAAAAERYARTAIEAMREPTPRMQMVNQGVFMNPAKGYTTDGSDWQRIIDAALTRPTSE